MNGILDTDLTACEGDDNRLEFLYGSVFHDWCYVCILVDTYMAFTEIRDLRALSRLHNSTDFDSSERTQHL